MGKVKIVDMKERVRFTAPGKRETDVDVAYETEKGYRGTVTLAKKGLTEEKVIEVIREDMRTQEGLLEKEITV
jgi:hypothetical protein